MQNYFPLPLLPDLVKSHTNIITFNTKKDYNPYQSSNTTTPPIPQKKKRKNHKPHREKQRKKKPKL